MINNLTTTLTILILMTILLFLIKPNIFFGQDGQIKTFGSQMTDTQTPITLSIFIYGVAILIYILLLSEKKS